MLFPQLKARHHDRLSRQKHGALRPVIRRLGVAHWSGWVGRLDGYYSSRRQKIECSKSLPGDYP
jgi:hypothetical protein